MRTATLLLALTLAALSLGGCATNEEPIDLANGETKTDGSAYIEVTLTKADRVRFQVACSEFFSCDITIAAAPTSRVYEQLDQMFKTARASDFPRGVVDVEASALGFVSSIPLSLAPLRGDPRVDGGGPIGIIGNAVPVYYGFSTSLPPAGARDKIVVDLSLNAGLPFDDGRFLIYAFWH